MTALCRDKPVSNIRIVGCDGGEVFHIHGENAGLEGVELLAGGLEALWEAPIRILERTPVRMDGGVLRAVKTAIMEPVITVGITGKFINETFGVVDGALREAFSFELDPYYDDSTLARIEWETDEGTRWLEVVLTAGASYDADLDPHKPGYWRWEIHLKAYTPYWQSDPVIEPVEFTAAGSKTVIASNPTGVDMAQIWRGTVAQWELPDNSWAGRRWAREPGGLYPDRTVLYPNITAANGGLVVEYGDVDLAVRDVANTNLIGQMPVQGDGPRHKIPAFTQEVELTVTATHVPAGGAMMQLVQPRFNRKPWGRV